MIQENCSVVLAVSYKGLFLHLASSSHDLPDGFVGIYFISIYVVYGVLASFGNHVFFKKLK